MSNSPLVVYTKLSPNHSGTRTHAIDRITPHCVVGQCTIETLGNIFAPVSRQASSNYGIDKDGRVGMFCEEKNRSWCSSSYANDQRAVTIECASDSTEPYAFKDVVYKKLIELCVDICKRNGKTKLLWISDKAKALAYAPKSNEMLLTVHRWFANKSCPGSWLMARMDDLATKVTAQLGSTPTPTPASTAVATKYNGTYTKSVSGSGYSAYGPASSYSGVWKTTDELNLRDKADPNSKVLINMKKGSTVRSWGFYSYYNGAKWFCVETTYNKVKYTGYCNASYLTKV